MFSQDWDNELFKLNCVCSLVASGFGSGQVRPPDIRAILRDLMPSILLSKRTQHIQDRVHCRCQLPVPVEFSSKVSIGVSLRGMLVSVAPL